MRRSTSRLYALAGARAARHDSGTLTSTIGPVLLENLRHGVQQGQEQGRGLSAKLVRAADGARLCAAAHKERAGSIATGGHQACKLSGCRPGRDSEYRSRACTLRPSSSTYTIASAAAAAKVTILTRTIAIGLPGYAPLCW